MIQSKPVVHGGYLEAGQKWRFKRHRGTGSFIVERVDGDRVTLRSPVHKFKTISVKTLRGDYERMW